MGLDLFVALLIMSMAVLDSRREFFPMSSDLRFQIGAGVIDHFCMCHHCQVCDVADVRTEI